MASKFDKYQNPDKRCGYPFTPDPVGYCWTYAHHVDGTEGFDNLLERCAGCKMWEEVTDV